MSTELETTKTTESTSAIDGAPPAEAIRGNGSPSKTPKPWQLRRYQLAAGVLIALVVAAAIGNNLIARQYTPEGAVRQYLAALQVGDASTAWSQLQFTSLQKSPTASLTGESALRAALAIARPDIKGYDVTRVSSRNETEAVVNVAIQTTKGTRQAQFLVERSGERRYGLYPTWKVVVAPALLSFALPAGIGGLAIDGQALDLKAGVSQVAVLPVVHKVTFKGTSLLAEQTVTVDAFVTGDQAVEFQPVFTSGGLDKVKGAVRSFYADVCAKATSALASSNCPQRIPHYIQQSGSWELVGDSAQDLTTTIDQNQKIYAGGRFQMVFGYRPGGGGWAGTQHEPDGSGYSALLVLSDSDVKVDHIARDNAVKASQRPAGATDQAAEAVVGAAFKRCASVSAEFVADCPQAAPDALLEKVRWSLQGDPTSGATVSYDGATGLLTVHGNFSMAVSYTWFGQARNRSSYITHYDAYLFWDGSQLQLVTIDGSPS